MNNSSLIGAIRVPLPSKNVISNLPTNLPAKDVSFVEK